MKLGTNVDYTIASVTACSIVNFLLPWQPAFFHCLRPQKESSRGDKSENIGARVMNLVT
jgi:hypothetical protein